MVLCYYKEDKNTIMKKIIIIILILILLLGLHFLLLSKKVTDWREDSLLERMARSYCDFWGRKWISGGFGIAGCSYECQEVYKDGGTPCTTSADCTGKCKLNKGQAFENRVFNGQEVEGCTKTEDRNYNCTIPLSGECQFVPPSNCGNFWERDGSQIKYNAVSCSM